MIKRLEGYTGNGFQERNGYIILNTDLNILKLKKAKNDEKERNWKNGKNEKNEE